MELLKYTAFANLTTGHIIMIAIALFLIAIAIIKEYEPIILLPLAFGILIGNIPFSPGLKLGIYEDGSFLSYLNLGITKSIYPSLLLLGVGAMTDFSPVLSNPKLLFVGIAGQIGIFIAFIAALFFGFSPLHSGALSMIGAADAPASIFLASKLAPSLIAPIAISASICLALVSLIQPPIMKLLTTKKERMIRMKPPRTVSRKEKIIFPVIGLLLICFIVPASLPLLGMLFLGNILKESGVTNRLSESLKTVFLDIVIIIMGVTIGVSSEAGVFFNNRTLMIFIIGIVAFIIATFSGIIFVKFMNFFLSIDNKINPLIGNAGVSSLPYSARVSQKTGLAYDKTNHLLMHALGPNSASIIGSAIAAGILLTFLYQ
jgi:oxaloacetate decarboxylase beta subunit